MKVKNLPAIVVISIIATIGAPDTSAQMANEPPSAENRMSDSDILSIKREYEASDEIKNYKTFIVEADYEGEYNAGFWLLPAKYSDGNYTNFEVYVNGTNVGFITPTKGNWQFATITDKPCNQLIKLLHKIILQQA